MRAGNYGEEFKRDAVHQIAVRRYQVREVSRRSGVRTYSLCIYGRLFLCKVSSDLI